MLSRVLRALEVVAFGILIIYVAVSIVAFTALVQGKYIRESTILIKCEEVGKIKIKQYVLICTEEGYKRDSANTQTKE